MPVHGYKIGENYWAGQIVKYTCDTGYFMEGPTNRLCLENGNWSDVVPKCNEEECFIDYILFSLMIFVFLSNQIIEKLLMICGKESRELWRKMQINCPRSL